DLDRVIVGILQVLLLADLALVGFQTDMSAVYYVGLLFAALFAVYEQVLIRRRNPQRCFQAFMNNNWFGAAVFAGILLHYTFTGGL
ncbi:MAG: 4-hydroxybenzoate octaprenyltransferase, partial [Gammaproteobacteria bacterium]